VAESNELITVKWQVISRAKNPQAGSEVIYCLLVMLAASDR
jgi:hypothetical protein